MKKLSIWFYKVSSGWVALLGLVIFLLFSTFVLPAQAVEADSVSAEAGSPDMSFFYQPQELYEMAEAYGEQGRQTYIRARFTFDLIWPIVYTLFITTAISWTYRSVFSVESLWRWANLVPFFGMIFDYAENISTSLVMFRYPTTLDIFATLAPILTAIKWILVSGSFIILLIGISGKIWLSARKRLIKNT